MENMTFSAAQIALIRKMNVQRIQTDNTEFFTGAESHVLNGLIALDIVQKVRGTKGWSAWQVVNYYDLLDNGLLNVTVIEAAPAPRECGCGQLLNADEVKCAACSHWNALGYKRPDTEVVYSERDGLVIGILHKDPEPLDTPPAETVAQDETTDAAPVIDPRDARIVELEAQVKALQSLNDALEAKIKHVYDNFELTAKPLPFEEGDDEPADDNEYADWFYEDAALTRSRYLDIVRRQGAK